MLELLFIFDLLYVRNAIILTDTEVCTLNRMLNYVVLWKAGIRQQEHRVDWKAWGVSCTSA